MVRCSYLNLLPWLVLVVSVTEITGVSRESYNARLKLVENLTKNHEVTAEVLPVVDSFHNVTVDVGMTIQRIATVDEVNQAIRLIVWLRVDWTNPFLTWNPEEYDNISSIHLSNELIWKPDISLYNKASLEEEIDILYKRMTTPIIVGSNGYCQWKAPATLLSQCKIKVTDFPFDEQTCRLTFGSWTYTANKIDVYPANDTAMLDHNTPTGEWDIIAAPMRRNTKNYATGIYPDVTLSLRIKRRPLYFTLNLIIPCTVISLLSFLSFVLPTNHGERVSLVITVLLAMSVYMLIVSSTLPQTSDSMPIIGTYFLCIIVEIACCLLATCLVAQIRERESEIPKWLDNVINKKLARCLLITLRPCEYSRAGTKGSYENNLDIVSAGAEEAETNRQQAEVCCEGLDAVSAELAVLTNDVNIRQKREIRFKKWHNVADVLDRLFLIVFVVIFGILTAAVFAR